MNNNKLFKAIIGIIIVIAIGLLYWMFPNIDNNNVDVNNPIGVIQNAYEENLKLYFFNVGNADSALIINKDEAMIIDGGNTINGKNIYKYITEELGYYNIKYIVATHADRDHIGGLPTIIENMNSIETIFMPNTDKQTAQTKNIINSVNNKKISVIEPEIDSEYILGNAKFKIKWVATETQGEKDENGKTRNVVSSNST